MFLHETYVVGGEDSNVEHYVSVTQIAQWLTDPDANKRTFTSLLQARYFHHVYNLVKWGKLSLTPAHTDKSLTFWHLMRSPKHSYPIRSNWPPLTEADTAIIHAVISFNTRKYLSSVPLVTNIAQLKRVVTRTG